MAYILPNGRRLSGLETESFYIGEGRHAMSELLVPGFCERNEIQIVPDTREESRAKRAIAYSARSDRFFIAALSYRAEGREADALASEEAGRAEKAAIRAEFPYDEEE